MIEIQDKYRNIKNYLFFLSALLGNEGKCSGSFGKGGSEKNGCSKASSAEILSD
jgi:hypothetical protein